MCKNSSALNQLQHTAHFRVRIIKMRRETDIILILPIGAQGSEDAVLSQSRVKFGHIRSFAKKTDHASAIFRRGGTLKNGITFLLEQRNDPGTFAENLAADVFDAHLREQIDRSMARATSRTWKKSAT